MVQVLNRPSARSNVTLMSFGDRIVAIGGKPSDTTLYIMDMSQTTEDLSSSPATSFTWTPMTVSAKVSQTHTAFHMYRNTLYAYETLPYQPAHFYALTLFKVRHHVPFAHRMCTPPKAVGPSRLCHGNTPILCHVNLPLPKIHTPANCLCWAQTSTVTQREVLDK